jgi:hypothetical protein
MKTHIDFNTSTLLLDSKTTFGGMQVSNYVCGFDDDTQRYFESFDLSDEYEYWSIPSLLANIAGDMRYWNDYRQVSSVKDLLGLIESAISKYTDDDLSKCIGWDDFDDYLVLLFIAGDEIRRYKVEEDDIHHFNCINVEEDI